MRIKETAVVMTAEQVKAKRLELGLTQTKFAERVGVTLRSVQFWEAGTNRVSPMAAKSIAALKPERRPTPATPPA